MELVMGTLLVMWMRNMAGAGDWAGLVVWTVLVTWTWTGGMEVVSYDIVGDMGREYHKGGVVDPHVDNDVPYLMDA